MPKPTCPKCGNPLIVNTDAGMFCCPNCGFKRAETLDEASERIRARGQRPAVAITQKGGVDLRVRSLFESAQDDLWRGDKANALRLLQESLDLEPNFADAHLWIAKISDDPSVQRDHLGEIIARDPGHQEALRLLMVLNGQMTPQEAEMSRVEREPELRWAAGAVKAQTTALLCPVCGGELTIDEANGRVVCRFCGHSAPLDPRRHASDGAEILGAALLKRRAQPVRWIVGERILHCTQCGAERTIPAERLSTLCPFCGSTQVIERDALQSFEQPDGLVPFAVSEEQAKAALHQQLRGVGERLAGLLGDNKVVRNSIEGMYLPYWVFDALVEITRTTHDRREGTLHERPNPALVNQTTTLNDGLNSVAIPAVKSPPATLTDGLGAFDVSAAVAYEPTLLAKYPAELYAIDFEAASLTAHSRISEHMRQRHGQGGSSSVEVTIFTSVLQMSFTLLLLPVWVATLYERDGDVRLALVNGRTGKVALGKAQRPS